jgi:hypothetical protein
MQNPWRAKAAEFHQRASDAGDPQLREELEIVALAYSRAADFRSRADGERDPYFRDEFARIAAGYAGMAARRDVAWSNGDASSPEDAKDR